MAQLKVYGQRQVLDPLRTTLSDVLHAAAVDVLGLPADKRFHRFFPMDPPDFPTPVGRSDRYTVIEVLLFEGRATATKKAFYQRLYRDFAAHLSIAAVDLEVTLVETPRHDWAIRGQAGDDLVLTYEVEPKAAARGQRDGTAITTGRQLVSSSAAWEPVVGYSRAVRVGSWISVAGTTAALPGGGAVGGDDAGEQTREVLRRIAAALDQVGAGLEHVVRTRMFVTDISRWQDIGRAHGTFFADVRPASSMVEVSALIDPALLVEIEADAVVP